MIPFLTKTTKDKKTHLTFFSDEGFRINWNWLYLKSPFIFGSLLGMGVILFILWLIF